MTAAGEIRDRQARCQPHLLRLQTLARGEDEPALAAAQAGRATGAIIAEVEAAIQAVLAADGDSPRHLGARTFLRGTAGPARGRRV